MIRGQFSQMFLARSQEGFYKEARNPEDDSLRLDETQAMTHLHEQITKQTSTLGFSLTDAVNWPSVEKEDNKE